MSCSYYDKIITDPKNSDVERRKALINLVKQGCLSSLYYHATSFSRIQWIRDFALLALVKFSIIPPTTKEVTIKGEKITLDENLELEKKRSEAARYLFVFLNDTKKPRKMRISALLGLIKGNHMDYCLDLLNDPSTERWIRIKIRDALGHKQNL